MCKLPSDLIRLGLESNLRPSGSEPDATTNSCYSGILVSHKPGWKESNLHTTASKAVGLPLADTRTSIQSSGRRTRTFTSLLNREVPYQFGYTGIYKSGWSDSNRRSRAHEARGIIKLSDTLLNQSAQRESNSQFLLGKEVGYHYTMDAFVGSTELSKIRAPSENRTHVATLRGRRHSTRPSVLFHSVGPEGIEPSTFVL